MKAIATQNAPAAIGPYSQAIKAGNTVYVSGQLGIDPSTGNFAEGGTEAQARQSLTNISNILKEAGLSMKNVAKVTVLLADINDFAAVNEIYKDFFEAPFPARSAFAVAALPKGGKIEIEAIAVSD
ncbi:MAG: RidA family protein [Prevotellaceae bacterium]|nr:RidA family protein [Prevotellaceae bacterium]